MRPKLHAPKSSSGSRSKLKRGYNSYSKQQHDSDSDIDSHSDDSNIIITETGVGGLLFAHQGRQRHIIGLDRRSLPRLSDTPVDRGGRSGQANIAPRSAKTLGRKWE
jgi:hypothetical protein